MNDVFSIKDLIVVAVIYEMVSSVYTCVYIVESRRVNERAVEWEYPVTETNKCEIMARLRDRWTLVDRPKERMRIRGNAMVVKYGSHKVRYRCMESRGHTFLLGTSSYPGNRHGVLCLGFVHNSKPQVAEYSIVRLNGHGLETHLLSPQMVSVSSPDKFPTLNETCFLRDDGQGSHYAYIRRAERRCVIPDELIRSWNYTFHSVKHVTFAYKTFTLTMTNETRYRFDCNVNEGDVYVFRSLELVSPQEDGVVCFNITKLVTDPHYKYEMSRLNSGETLEGMVKSFPVGKPVALYEDCDWLDSPARPEYLY